MHLALPGHNDILDQEGLTNACKAHLQDEGKNWRVVKKTCISRPRATLILAANASKYRSFIPPGLLVRFREMIKRWEKINQMVTDFYYWVFRYCMNTNWGNFWVSNPLQLKKTERKIKFFKLIKKNIQTCGYLARNPAKSTFVRKTLNACVAL